MNPQQPHQPDPDRTTEGQESHEIPATVEPATERSTWASIRFAIKAIEIRLRFVAVLVAIGLLIGYWDTIVNYWDKWTRPAAGASEMAPGTEFYCPMHPSVVRATADPGGAVPSCPICGMPLSKRKRGEKAALPEGVIGRVQLSPERIQFAGIRTEDVERRDLEAELRAVGFVDFDESRLSRIVIRTPAYVEKLLVNKSFEEVRKGQPLAELYSPELYTIVQEMLIAKQSNSPDLVELGRTKLELLGIMPQDIDAAMAQPRGTRRLVIRSPIDGHLIRKEVIEGDYVEAGTMLFEVADLSVVWIEGEVFETDIALLKAGQAVTAMVESYPGKVFEGTLSLIHPHLETATRTLRVRFELKNPGHLLRPGMYATVALRTPLKNVEPFATRLALPSKPEAKDDTALAELQRICPVTGAKLGSMGEPVRVEANGQPVLLCCQGCEGKINSDPERYLQRLRTVGPDGVLAVPQDAVIDTGEEKIVYVEHEPGVFDGVLVTLGPKADGYYAVLEGLLPGDRVATAGAFLVDAETRLNPAAAASYFGAGGSPSASKPESASAESKTKTGDPAASKTPAPLTAEEQANIDKLPPADRAQAMRQRVCPITDEPLGSMGVPIKVELNGRIVFLCCAGCRGDAIKNPDKTLKKLAEATASAGPDAGGAQP